MKKRAYEKMMSRYGIRPNSRERAIFVQMTTVDAYDERNGITKGQSFRVLEELDGAFKVSVPFRDFPYPVRAINVRKYRRKTKRIA
jgi:hypothetical protein